ncbi:MAG: MFS transporter [Actinomycetota bacterium]|nr:MAG: MFS transporter [Actinomycetota bacterium]
MEKRISHVPGNEESVQNSQEAVIGEVDQDVAMFAAFKVFGFGRIWASILSGNSGRFSLIVVAGWEAYKISRSAFWSSIIAFCILMPVAFIGPVAGATADRINKASQMAIGQTVAMIAALLAAIFLYFGHLTLGLLVATTAGVGVGNAIQNPAWASLTPAVIGVKRMVNGGAMIRIAQQGSEFLGPAVATPLLVRFGPIPVYVLCGICYGIASSLSVSLRKHVPRIPSTRRGVYNPLKEALVYVFTKQRLVGALLIVVGLHCGLTMAYTGILPKLAESNLQGSSGIYGGLLVAVGIGAIIGAILVIIFARWLDLKFMLVLTGVVSGLSLVLLGASMDAPLALAGAVMVGASQSAFMALYLALLQGTAAPEFRGRVAAFSNILVGSTMSSFALLWGWLTTAFPVAWVIAVPGIVFVISLGVMMIATPWLKPPKLTRIPVLGPADL